MSRFVVTFCLLSLIFCSVGCRICPTPYDCRISAYIDRSDDYRGFDPMYRAGSIFCGCNGTHQVVKGAFHETKFVDYYSNAGNYGMTTPIVTPRQTPGTNTFETRPNTESPLIGIPRENPEYIGFPMPFPNGVPSVRDLLDRNRETLQLPVVPITPPGRPRTAPSYDDMPGNTIPFSPSDAVPNNVMPNNIAPDDEAITPPSTFPPMIMETDPPITLEELRRLDPTIQEVQIISIEDVLPIR